MKSVMADVTLVYEVKKGRKLQESERRKSAQSTFWSSGSCMLGEVQRPEKQHKEASN